MTRPLDRVLSTLLGHEPKQRLRLGRTLLAACVYGLCLVAEWATAGLGFAAVEDAACLTAFCTTGAVGFAIAIRSGFALRFADPALTTPQMVFAILSVAFAYHVNAVSRGAMPMIVALVLVHGAFILPPRRCVHLGLFAVAVFGATMAFGIWHDPQRFDPAIEALIFSIIASVLPAIAYLSGQLSALRASERTSKRELRQLMEQMRTLATQDDLTGLPNRRHIQEWMPHEIARLRRNGGDLCIAILDLDLFKRVNDTFGHAVGDQVLCLFAAEVKAELREGDVLARWGGEEFLLVMPDAGVAEAQAAIERARQRLRTTGNWTAHPQSRVTFSAGLTRLGPGETLEQAVEWADFALYEAKARGRDRTNVARLRGAASPAMERAARTAVTEMIGSPSIVS